MNRRHPTVHVEGEGGDEVMHSPLGHRTMREGIVGKGERIHHLRIGMRRATHEKQGADEERRDEGAWVHGDSLGAKRAGDYGRADALFESFAREFPNDSRAEDALFLRADARARRGDREGARRAAADYLKRYPNGFRRAEAQRLTGP